MVTSHLSDTVEMLKNTIESKTNIPVASQKLIFQGRVLRNEQSLQDCRITDNCAIFMIRQTNTSQPNQPNPSPEPTPRINPPQPAMPGFQNVLNPIIQSITSAIGTAMQGLDGNGQGQATQMGPFSIPGGGSFQISTSTTASSTPFAATTSTPNPAVSTTSTADDILDEVLNDTTDGITEAHILPTEDEVSTPVQQQPPQQQPSQQQPSQQQPSQQQPSQQQPSQQQPSQQQPATQAESLMRSIQQNTNDLLLQNNHDPTAAAVAAYISNLSQTAQFLQRKLHESNFTPNAWGQMQQALQQHISLTQNLIRLPAPAMNRGEPASVSVVATSIPIGTSSFNPEQVRQLLQRRMQGRGNERRPNHSSSSSSGNGNNSNSNNRGDGPSDDYNGMYM